MTGKVINTLCLAVASLILCCILGCVTMEHRLYSGAALTKNEVALVYSVADCRIQTIRDMREKEEKALGEKPQYMLELLPGEYNSVLQFGRVVGRTIMAGSRLQRKLFVQAGNIYVIYPDVKGPNMSWRPIIINISEYSKEECEKSSGGRGLCPNKDNLIEKAMEYLQGERHAMSYHPAEIAITYSIEGETRVYNGFWW